MLTAVGFSSPPAWVKPYRVLSQGEQFRCDLARALLTGKRRVVFDEFTSVVDRTVARIGSAAVAKAVRRSGAGVSPANTSSAAILVARKQFVAVTCHYDVAEWLEPDWVLDMADRTEKRETGGKGERESTSRVSPSPRSPFSASSCLRSSSTGRRVRLRRPSLELRHPSHHRRR